MKKRLMLIPLALAIFGMAACSSPESSDSSSSSSAPESSESSSSEASSSSSSSASSSSAAASSGSSSSSGSSASEESGLPTPVDATIAELAAKTKTDTSTLYRVSGILEDCEYDSYGNGYLTNPETGDSICIYGSSLEADSGLSYSNGVLSYTNPKKGASIEGFASNGDYVTMLVMYTYYEGYTSKVPEIMGHFVSAVDSTYTYSVDLTAPDSSLGSVSLSASSGLTYGQTVTVTVSPNQGYGVTSISLTGSHGDLSSNLTLASDGTYSFPATCVNKLSVEFGEVTIGDSLVLTSTNLNAPTTSYGDTNVIVDTVSITCEHIFNSGYGIQMRYKSSTQQSSIYNTSATPYKIKNIVFAYNTAKQSSTDNLIFVAFGTSSMAEATTGQSVAYTASTITITPDAETYDYFKIGHTNIDRAVYFDSITINYVVA